MRKSWSVEEEAFLRERLNELSYEDIGKAFNRTSKSVEMRARRLGIAGQKKRIRISAPLPIELLDTNLAYILGVLIGDGFLYYDKHTYWSFQLATVNKHFAETFAHALHRWIGRKTPHIYTQDNSRGFSSGNIYIVRKASKEHFLQIKSLIENLSFESKLTTESLKTALLRGYYDSDGSFSSWLYSYKGRLLKEQKLVLTDGNLEKLRLAQRLLTSIGICPTYISRSRTSYHLEFRAKRNIILFKEKVGFSIPYKQLKLEEWSKSL